MTTEEKAKAYDEALEKAKAHINNKGIGDTVDLCKHLFPELNESEDETTRKELLDFVKSFCADHGRRFPQVFRWISYLEKQKENPWSEEDESIVKTMCKEGDLKPSERVWLMNLKSRMCKESLHVSETCKGNADSFIGISKDEGIRKAIKLILIATEDEQKVFYSTHRLTRKDCTDWLEKQKEQKPTSAEEVLAKAGLKPYKDGNQWCILAGDNIQEGICGFGDTIDEALYQFLMEVLEKQKEQKPRKFKLGDKVHWHDDNTNIITITGFRDDAYLTDSAYGPILFCGEDNWERVEQKPAESSNESAIQKGYKEGINDGIALVKKQPEDYGLQ